MTKPTCNGYWWARLKGSEEWIVVNVRYYLEFEVAHVFLFGTETIYFVHELDWLEPVARPVQSAITVVAA